MKRTFYFYLHMTLLLAAGITLWALSYLTYHLLSNYEHALSFRISGRVVLIAAIVILAGVLCRLPVPFFNATITPGFMLSALGVVVFANTRSFTADELRWFETAPDLLRMTCVLLAAALFAIGFSLPARWLRTPSLPSLAAALGLPTLVLISIFGHGPKLVGLAFGIAAAWSVGHRLLSRLPTFAGDTDSPSVALSFAVGLVLWQVTALILGAVSLLSASVVVAVVAGSFLLGLRSFTFFWRRKAPRAASNPAPWYQLVVFSVAFACLAMGCVAALAPEVGSDALGARLAMPVRFLAQKSVAPFPDILWSYGVIGGEVLVTFFLPFLGWQALKLLNVATASILFLSLLKRFSHWPFFLASLFTSTLVFVQFFFGHVELLQLLFWFSAADAAFLALQGRLPWFLVGALMGAAAAVKLNALALAVVLVPALLLAFWKKLKQLYMCMFQIGLGVFATLGPFLLRAFLLTGNPFFPWFNSLFRSNLVEEVPIAHFGVGLSPKSLILLPWLFLKEPQRFVEVGSWHALVVTALFVVMTLAFFSAKEGRWFAYLALTHWVLWAVTEQNLRYSMSPALFTSVAASFLSASATLHNKKWNVLLSFTYLSIFISGLFVQLAHPIFWPARTSSGIAFPTNVVMGKEDTNIYLRTKTVSFAAAEFLKAQDVVPERICQIGLRDHLYFPGLQPTNWHSIAPLAKSIFTANFSQEMREVQRSLRELQCPLVVLALGQQADKPWQQRLGIYSQQFLDGSAQVIFAHQGTLVLAPAQGRRPETTSSPKASNFQECSLEGAKAHFGDNGTWHLPSSAARLCQTAPVTAGTLLRLNLTSKTAGSGKADFAFRGQGNKLLGFNSLVFSFSEGSQSWSCWQTAPPGTQHVTVALAGGPVAFTTPVLSVEDVSWHAIRQYIKSKPPYW